MESTARKRGTDGNPPEGIPFRDLEVSHYLRWTRDVSVAWAYLLPLLAVYEIGLIWFRSDHRNSAELIFKDAFGWMPGWAVWLHYLLLLAVVVVAIDLFRRKVPALRLYPLFLMEALFFALLLGPLISFLVHTFGLRPVADGPLRQQLLLSIGAGIYEEIVFRFLLLAGLFAFLCRAARCDRTLAFVIALLFSASLFALYHHLGPGALPLAWSPVLFRFLAGILLGVVFALRGLALCVYLHAFYDILCDLRIQDLIP